MSEDSRAEIKSKTVDQIKKKAEEKACAVQKSIYFINEFIAGPMCGKCFPCAFGTAEAKIILNMMIQRKGPVNEKDIEALKRIGLQMIEGSFCKKGKDTGKFVIEILSDSEDDFRAHLSGICEKKECIIMLEYIIKPELCIMCGQCSDVCKHNAIRGEKKELYRSGYLPFVIRRKRCTKCGECIKVCPTGAIEIKSVAVEELVNQ